MKPITITPRFDIGQTVYFTTPESDPGIVIDWKYCRRERSIMYMVSFGAGISSLYYYEEELSETKKFN